MKQQLGHGNKFLVTIRIESMCCFMLFNKSPKVTMHAQYFSYLAILFAAGSIHCNSEWNC